MLSRIAHQNLANVFPRLGARAFSRAAAASQQPTPDTKATIQPQEALARKVMKFGGSSVGSADALYRVAEILRNEKDSGNE